MNLSKRPSDEEREENRTSLLLLTAGLHFGAAVGIGAALGWWLDQKLGTEPFLVLGFMTMGIVAGFINLYRLVQKVSKSFDNPPES
jgi:ATP synthase protein I